MRNYWTNDGVNSSWQVLWWWMSCYQFFELAQVLHHSKGVFLLAMESLVFVPATKPGSIDCIEPPISTVPPTCMSLVGLANLEPSIKKTWLLDVLDVFEKHIHLVEVLVLHGNVCTIDDCSLVDGMIPFNHSFDLGVNALLCAHETDVKLMPMLVQDITCVQIMPFSIHVKYVIPNEFVDAHAQNYFEDSNGKIALYMHVSIQ